MVRIEAARGLAAFRGVDSVYALAALLDDPYRSVRVAAASSMVSQNLAAIRFSPEKQKSFDKAIGELRQSFEIEGDHPDVQVRRGGLESALGNLADARTAYDAALREDAGNADAYAGLALVEVRQGNREAALRDARKAADLSGKEAYKKLLEDIQSRSGGR